MGRRPHFCTPRLAGTPFYLAVSPLFATLHDLLWQTQGKKAEARQRLAEIYGWFTEGFDTKDLQEAKALLEELNH